MSSHYIYTEKNNCQDCYKCIRECTVKAIKMVDHSASIIQDGCIYCGHCTTLCPVDAKKVKDDITKVKLLLNQGKDVYVSLAPSYYAEFPEYSTKQFISILKKLGFKAVSETALGAELVSYQLNHFLQTANNGVYISSCCPAVVELVNKYYNHQKDKILPIDTPMLTHGKILRQHYGQNIYVVFIGPCIAKKKEADMNPGVVDAVITFKRLREWIKEEGLDTANEQESTEDFQPCLANNGKLYPLEGGMITCVLNNDKIENLSHLSLSGVERIIPVLNQLDKLEGDQKVFLELMACEGGCIEGPGNINNDSVVVKSLKIASLEKDEKAGLFTFEDALDLNNTFNYFVPVKKEIFSELEINDTLQSIGKISVKYELNCGGCGYESCRDFAQAVLSQKAERTMCVSYMRRIAQDKANTLLQRMPYGVVIVDRELKVVESNHLFAKLTGEEAVMAYDAKPGLEGADLRKLIPYASYFENLILSGESTIERDIRVGSQLIHLSIFTIQANQVLCGIIHNLRAPELNREEMVKRARTVVRDNLKTVQKIAFYLGENASNMETLLNSIVDIQNEEADA